LHKEKKMTVSELLRKLVDVISAVEAEESAPESGAEMTVVEVPVENSSETGVCASSASKAGTS
jgi:hypothetical protein